MKKYNRMKKSMISYATLAVVFFTGCDKDQADIQADGRVALQVKSGIQTRAYGSTWEAEDVIGIYMLDGGTVEADNRPYTTEAGGTNGTFAPAATAQTIYFPVDGSTRDFVAYYPHTTIGDDHLYLVNIATQTSQKAIDLMAATKVIGKSKTDANVSFVFEHKLVKLDVTVVADGVSVTNDDLIGTTVNITGQQTNATYNVVEGGMVSVIPGPPAEIALKMNGLQAEGIILPNNTTQDMELTFTVPRLDGQVFKWAINKAVSSQQFNAGSKYKYTITIAKAELTVTSTVTDWVSGNGAGEEGSAE